MKSIKIILLLTITLLVSCQYEPAELPTLKETLALIDNGDTNTGLSTGSCPSINESPQLLDSIDMNSNIPETIDLSRDMPPVANQGTQGSCVAFATTYYMKSYQEKKQYGYDYITTSDVMSPAFIYNQSKATGDCSVGSCIENSLYNLKYKGVSTWQEFPYNAGNCSLLPNAEQLVLAKKNKIKSAYVLNSFTKENETHQLLDIIKNLLFTENPVIIAIKLDRVFTTSTPRNVANQFIYKAYDSTKHYGNHAMLIVGYDDNLNSFKVINSWGSGWGNQGYCYISYDFFKEVTDIDYKAGLLGSYVAFDE